MALDPDRLLALPPLETSQTFSRKDVILYALGVGAHELPFVFEEGLKTLPTIGLILANPGFFWKDPRYGVDWRRVLHGESSIVLHAPLPPEGEVRSVTTFGPVFDKGPEKGAICYQTRKVYDADGGQLATVRNASFLRGDGGFGGSSEGQPKPHPVPGRPPDDVQILPTADNQGLIYRLSGDLNPLHIDPAVALSGGFPKPILHGLCTFGIAGRSMNRNDCSGLTYVSQAPSFQARRSARRFGESKRAAPPFAPPSTNAMWWFLTTDMPNSHE